ncbi:MAG: helix-turn-helix transcriptional regulator [Firmicutes bacterium]|nr:helix-turn-helix transcriptional regulator [Bacillota bacterium]
MSGQLSINHIFSVRLKELRLEKNLTQVRLAEVFFVSQSAIADWECGNSQTNFDTLVKLAKFFEVSTDYLLGLEE